MLEIRALFISQKIDHNNYPKFRSLWKTLQIKHFFSQGVTVNANTHILKHLTPYGIHNLHIGRLTDYHISSIGEVGCFLAHRNAWAYAVKNNCGVIVCEDGCINYKENKISALLKHLHKFQCVFMHTHKYPFGIPYIQKDTCSSFVLEPKLILTSLNSLRCSTKMYYIAPNFAHQLLQNSNTFDLQVDAFIRLEAIKNNIYDLDRCNYMNTSENFVYSTSSNACKHNNVKIDTRQYLKHISPFLFSVFLLIICLFRK